MPVPFEYFRHEYVSAAIAMGPVTFGTEWNLDFFVANRGHTVESFRVFVTEGGATPSTDASNVYSVEPGHLGGWGWALEVDPDFVDYERRWARIFTTSLDLVPTMHFYVQGAAPPVTPFYFAPGDFAIFDVSIPLRPPIGPIEDANAVR